MQKKMIKTEKSLKRNILLAFSTGVIIVGIWLWAVYVSAAAELKRQAIRSSSNSVRLYMQQIDNNFSKIEQNLLSFLLNDNDLTIMENTVDADRRTLARQAVFYRLAELGSLNQDFKYFFVYNQSRDDILIQDNAGADYNTKINVRDTIREKINQNDDSVYSGWNTVDICGDMYFIRFVTNQTTVMGALTRVDYLVDNFAGIVDEEFKRIYFTDSDGRLLSGRSDGPLDSLVINADVGEYIVDSKEYLGMSTPSDLGDFSFAGMVLKSDVFAGLRRLRNIVLMLYALIVLYVLKMYRSMNERVSAPVDEIVEAMKSIESGDLDVRLDIHRDFSEFQTIKRRFNDMAGQIRRLKIEVYEKKISKQKAELKFLQLQVNPHFFLNTLNVIYSLVLTKNNELLKKIVLALVRHARYTLKITEKFVRIADELAFVENFIEIQRIRFNFAVKFYTEVADGLKDRRIPPLIIHTFIENSIKYALTDCGEIEIYLRINYRETNGKAIRVDQCGNFAGSECLCIHIEDNGPGYAPEILDKLKRGSNIVDAQGQEHYGINNVMKRMTLIYDMDDGIEIYNRPEGGAAVDLWIPVEGEDSQ